MIEDKYISSYWNGNTNKAIRYYFYVQRGLTLLNEMRYLIMAILAIYAIMKLENWMIMPLMFFASLPILGILGYISVHHMSQKMDYYSNYFGSHYTKKSLEIQEETLSALNKLNERLSNGANPNHSNSHNILHKNP